MKKVLLEVFNSLPQGVVDYINCRRRRKYWLSQRLLFIHVPKAAGTSISHAIYGRSLGHLKACDIKRWCPHEYANHFTFGFVRNPWDRAVSSYRFALEGSTETAGMWRPERYNIPEFRSFDAFVNEWLVDNELARIDNVFQPQYLFVTDDRGEIIVDFIGKVEHMVEDIKTLASLTGRNLEIPDLNRVTEPGSYRKYYANQQLINVVGDLYQKDIDLFGYDF